MTPDPGWVPPVHWTESIHIWIWPVLLTAMVAAALWRAAARMARGARP